MATRMANTGSGAPTANAPPDAGAVHRYIVVAPGDVAPERLEAIAGNLATTAPRLQVQPDAYLAFAELAVMERAQQSRSAWGLARVERLGLALTDDAALDADGRAALRAVAERLLPTARIVELGAERRDDSAALRDRSDAPEPDLAGAAHDIDDDDDVDDDGDDALPFEPRRHDPPTELEPTQVTAEELAMLLDDREDGGR